MLHTKLFENFPGKFHIYTQGSNEYLICGKNIIPIYEYMIDCSMYKDVIKNSIDPDGEFYVVRFKYKDEDDFVDTFEFDENKLKETFPDIINVSFVPWHYPFTKNADTGNYYIISTKSSCDLESLKNYMFYHFGYFLIDENTINNKTFLRFYNHESCCD